MKAFVIDGYTKPVTAADVPDPQVGPNDVLVRIEATSVNPLDTKIRDGEFKRVLPYSFPLIMGNDLAGTVLRVGDDVARFSPGDEVYARPRHERIGTFAESIAVDQAEVAHKPTNLTMAQAAAIPLVGLTAWQALVDSADVRPGQKVLIHAGSGGVGTVAIQLAKHLGATVATTTSTNNVEWVRGLGADVVIDYRTTDFASVIADYDVVLDTLGGETLTKSVGVLRRGGTIVSIAGPPDPAFARQLGLNVFLQQAMRALSFSINRRARKAGVTYSFLFMQASGEELEHLARLVESDRLRPIIDRTFAFDETVEALTYLEQGRAQGKVVITRT